MKKPELLAPAGGLEQLYAAILYGADAVYIGGEAYSLRVAAENFTKEQMEEGIKFAHSRGKKVYITANIIPHNSDIAEFEEYIKEISALDADGVIVSDLGMMETVKEIAPNLPIHVSTQANIVNYKTAGFYGKLGASRVVLGRELSLAEIREIREKLPESVEIEAFVHGAMCISYSGRCLLSNYLTERDSNLGACSHPCRWKYSLMEETREGQYLPAFENDRGTFIFNSKDLCMIDEIPALIKAGVMSFKIEGRVKTAYYVATVVKAYREAIDAYFENPDAPADPSLYEEIKKVSHREYTKGFYFGKPSGNAQVYTSSSYIRNYDLVGFVKSFDNTKKTAALEQRNRFFRGDIVEVVQPGKPYFAQKITYMEDEEGNSIDVAPHPKMLVKINMDEEISEGAFLRKVRPE